ncbi:MAG TPA: GspH/FimT family protein [Methylibium sp.]|uniref:GspH/FimT family pseudopilin n=1 Tax=Methylibium sp. TaxID=2067992 RepID=UPI002DB659DA|nr:GspH/FimT family protein [Methylibium sp.]HEU4457542.1 GspH/FimT family protein [Methylibium sp.]
MTNPRRAGARAMRGFTLVEISATLAVAATLATVALPSFGPMVERRQVEGATSQLVADLHFLRMQAVTRNRPLRISFGHHADGSSCYVLHADAPAQQDCTTEAEPIKTVRLAATSRLRLEANVASIVYDPGYGTSTPAGTLKMSAAGGTALHGVVNMMGRVRVCAPGGGFAGYRAC